MLFDWKVPMLDRRPSAKPIRLRSGQAQAHSTRSTALRAGSSNIQPASALGRAPPWRASNFRGNPDTEILAPESREAFTKFRLFLRAEHEVGGAGETQA
jgi:hypothetical protein